MFYKKVLLVATIFFSIILPLLSGCAKDSLKQKEIPITTNSNEALQLFLKGRDMFDKLKTPQAAELFDKAIALDKDFAMAYLYHANSGGGYKLYRENLSKAFDLLDKVSEGEKHLILYNQADNSVSQKVELDTILALFPNDKRVQDLAGNYYYGLADYSKALDHYKKVISLDSSFASSYNSLGYIYMGMENYAEAEKSFKKYIGLIPDDANPYDSYAELLLMQGRYDESIEQYNKAIQTDPEFVSALVGIGNNYIFKKDYKKARDYYQQSYDKSFNINQKLGALWWKAVSYIHEGKTADAISAFEERSKIAFDNNYPTAGITGYRFAGLTLADKGNIKEAERYINKAYDLINSSKLREEDHKAYEITVGLDRCYLQILKKDIAGAEKNLETLKQVIDKRQVSAENEYLNFITGLLQFHKGNNDLALQYFQKTGEGNPYIWYWKAITQEKAGNSQEAKKIYSKIAQYNANSVPLALVRDIAKNKL
jgi:tetratricopeptide (TPR) repeat protein